MVGMRIAVGVATVVMVFVVMIAINEFVAYMNFSPYLKEGLGNLDPKTIAIIALGLCGFANFGSIGVIVGAFGAIVPERTSEIAKLGFRALLAATLSNLMSATIARLFIGLAQNLNVKKVQYKISAKFCTALLDCCYESPFNRR